MHSANCAPSLTYFDEGERNPRNGVYNAKKVRENIKGKERGLHRNRRNARLVSSLERSVGRMNSGRIQRQAVAERAQRGKRKKF